VTQKHQCATTGTYIHETYYQVSRVPIYACHARRHIHTRGWGWGVKISGWRGPCCPSHRVDRFLEFGKSARAVNPKTLERCHKRGQLELAVSFAVSNRETLDMFLAIQCSIRYTTSTSNLHSAPPWRRSTYFLRSIFSTHRHTQQCYVVVT
jgi:hypothetical protein